MKYEEKYSFEVKIYNSERTIIKKYKIKYSEKIGLNNKEHS